MSSDWKSKLAFLQTKPIVQTIEGQDYAFYPVSVQMLFELKSMARPLATALTTFFSTANSDTGTVQRKTKEEEEVIVEAIRTDLAALRHNQRIDAAQAVVEAFTETKNMAVLASLIMDSLRDVFAPDKRTEHPPATEFLKAIPSTALPGLLKGLAAANKGVLGPLAQAVESKASEAAKAISLKMSQQDGETSQTT